LRILKTIPNIGSFKEKNEKKSPSSCNLGPYFSTSMQFWTNICQVYENSGHKFAEYCA